MTPKFKKTILPLLYLLLWLVFGFSPASAQTAEPSVARAVIFTSPICTFCKEIVEHDLPPVIERFGNQLQIVYIDVNTPDGKRLYEAALTAFNYPRGVPVIFIGESVLGGVNIVPKLPALVDEYLSNGGGRSWPKIPGLDEYLAKQQADDGSGIGSPTAVNSPQQLVIPTSEKQTVVQAVMLWMEDCPHCEEVIHDVLPPLREKYGQQFELHLIEVVTLDDINRLYDLAASYGFSKEQTGVPFLVIGETPLVGADQIRAQLPQLIEQHLASGEVFIPESLQPFLPVASLTPASAKTVVYIFWGSGCPHCEDARPFLRQLAQSYPGVEIREYEVSYEAQNQNLFINMAAAFDFEPHYVPTIFIGEGYWEGFSDRMKPELAAAIAACAETGCPDAGQGIVPASLSETAAIPAPAEMRDNGFVLAIITLIGMGIALLYSLAALVRGKTFPLPAWADWLIPIVIVIGMGVAGYLSYVETQLVAAVCGPVGDCNTVQSSRYAKLFDVLPVGVLGLLGYLGLLAAWFVRKFIPKLAKLAATGFLGMALFAVAFSIYLTYLELFVIKAVCIWCLTSALLVTMLLLLGLPPVLHFYTVNDTDEEVE